ncbi:unnamed protein product [Amoebophrya sp. A25]|nr:unnamed protein product [Amoebophrya sp. A25]|eukprot:GSA25T00023655001.1
MKSSVPGATGASVPQGEEEQRWSLFFDISGLRRHVHLVRSDNAPKRASGFFFQSASSSSNGESTKKDEKEGMTNSTRSRGSLSASSSTMIKSGADSTTKESTSRRTGGMPGNRRKGGAARWGHRPRSRGASRGRRVKPVHESSRARARRYLSKGLHNGHDQRDTSTSTEASSCSTSSTSENEDSSTISPTNFATSRSNSCKHEAEQTNISSPCNSSTLATPAMFDGSKTLRGAGGSSRQPPDETKMCSWLTLVRHLLKVKFRYFTTWTLYVLAFQLAFPGTFLDDYARAIRATITHVSLVGFCFVWLTPRHVFVDGVIRLEGWPFRIGDFFVHHSPMMVYWLFYERCVLSKLDTGGNPTMLAHDTEGVAGMPRPANGSGYAKEVFSNILDAVGTQLFDIQEYFGLSGPLPGAYRYFPPFFSSETAASTAFVGTYLCRDRYSADDALRVATTSPLWCFIFYALYRFCLSYLAQIDHRILYGLQDEIFWTAYWLSMWL